MYPINDRRTRSRRRIPIAVKLAGSFTLLLIFALGSLWLALDKHLHQLLDQQLDTLGHSLSQQGAETAAELILAEDQLGLELMLGSITKEIQVTHAAAYDEQGRLLAQSGQLNNNLPIKTYRTSIIFQDVLAGHLEIYLDKTRTIQSINQTLNTLGLITLFLLFLAVLLALTLAQHFIQPIKYLQSATQKLAKGQLDTRIHSKRHDELGELIYAFNRMAEGLDEKQKLEKTFSSYMSPGIASSIMSNLNQTRLPTEYIKATVVFVDIVGFTRLCEIQPAAQMAILLNQFYGCIHEAAQQYGGAVDKFIGDGAMLTFGVPKQDPLQGIHAICCAQFFLRRIKQLNVLNQRHGLPQLDFRVGLHAGELLAGTLGCKERMEYTLLGDTVNVAARLCDQGETGQIVISDDLLHLHRVKQQVSVVGKKQIKVKGRQESLTVYEVIDMDVQLTQDIDLHLEELPELTLEATHA